MNGGRILMAFKTRVKSFNICLAERKENVIKWRYTSAKRCVAKIAIRSA